MWNVVLFITLAATGLREISGYSLASPLDALNTQLDIVNDLVTRVQIAYRDDMYHHPLPKDYGTVMAKTCATLSKTSSVVDQAKGVHCQPMRRMLGDDSIKRYEKPGSPKSTGRRSNSNLDLMFEINFYKGLSRALREEFKDRPEVLEHIHEGLTPPTAAKHRKH